jgi:hypothetical protein
MNSCIQEYQSSYEEYDTSRKFVLKEFKNIDIISGTSEENEFGEAVFTAQEEQPTKRKRSAMQSLENCSKIPDSESETLITSKKSSKTKRDWDLISNSGGCKRSLPADEDTLLPKKVILRNCGKILTLTNAEFLSTDKEITVPRKAATLRNSNNNPTVRKKEPSLLDSKSPRKQILESCESGPSAVKTILATDAVMRSNTVGMCGKNIISRKESLLSSGKEGLVLKKEVSEENLHTLSLRKGNMLVKEVPFSRKVTLMENDITVTKQKLLSDTEKNIDNCEMNPAFVNENPLSGCRLGKTVENCDTNPAAWREKLLLSDSDASSGTSINAENYSKRPPPKKEKLVSGIHDTAVLGMERNVEYCYSNSCIRKEDAQISRTEDSLGDCDSMPVLKKNKLLTIEKQVLLSVIEKILGYVSNGSLSREEKRPVKNEESLESVRVQVPENGEKNQTLEIKVPVVNNEVRDPVARQERCSRNPTSTKEQLCEQKATSQRESLWTPKPLESCITIKGQNFASEYVRLPTSDEECVEPSLDASTIIIHPLLSCKYENMVPKIRKQLKNPQENVQGRNVGGPLLIHERKQIVHLSPEYKLTP